MPRQPLDPKLAKQHSTLDICRMIVFALTGQENEENARSLARIARLRIPNSRRVKDDA